MEDERISAQLEEKARALGFSPQAQTLEVHGQCADCARKSARAVRASR
jgi:Fur family zinc uptake transcriptional regulator